MNIVVHGNKAIFSQAGVLGFCISVVKVDRVFEVSIYAAGQEIIKCSNFDYLSHKDEAMRSFSLEHPTNEAFLGYVVFEESCDLDNDTVALFDNVENLVVRIVFSSDEE